MRHSFRKFNFHGLSGIFIALALVGAICFLSYILMQNPYQFIHKDILKTADNIRSYYRDSPGYWKLDTNAAQNASLIAEELLQHPEFDLKIGQGANGELSMPYNITFDITISHLNKSACIGLSETKISEKHRIGLHKITILTPDKTTEFVWGDKEHGLPISKWETRHICQSTENKIIWTFQ